MKVLHGGASYKKDQSMKTADLSNSYIVRLGGFLILLFWALFFAVTAHGGSGGALADTPQRLFPAPEQAAQALTDATKVQDQAALASIFGANYQRLLSGDETQDQRELTLFADALNKSAILEKSGPDKYTLTVGGDHWPFPIPIVKQGDQWRFDTGAGMEEILNRRIGENELSAIATCRAYVLAQWEYFTEGDHDNDGVAEYAQHFISAPGKKDGLYWDTAEGETPSPMGELVAAARAEGYRVGRDGPTARKTNQSPPHRHPYHGYYFRILKRQGVHAPGGKYVYVINGNMIAGYALIAYPDKWGSSGVMTFIVNQQGRVYQKNLGPNTLRVAGAITEYDPDPSWALVKE
jgi:hypothetical protein